MHCPVNVSQVPALEQVMVAVPKVQLALQTAPIGELLHLSGHTPPFVRRLPGGLPMHAAGEGTVS